MKALLAFLDDPAYQAAVFIVCTIGLCVLVATLVTYWYWRDRWREGGRR